MKIGIDIFGTERLFGGDHRGILALATEADRRGVDLLTTSDHLGFTTETHATRVRENGFPWDLEQSWPEAISLLSAVAAVTERARLGAFVLIAPIRPALLLAKQIATLDVLSGGRCHMGVGAGWQQLEFDATGVPFDGRFGRLEETVAACRALWGPQPVSFSGKSVEFADFRSLPRPVQDRVPMVFGVAPSKRNFDRIARVGDGWAAAPADVSQLEEGVALLHRCFEEQGRDPGDAEVQMIVRGVRDNSGAVEYGAMTIAVEKAVGAGVDTVLVQASILAKTPDDIDPMLTWLTGLKG